MVNVLVTTAFDEARLDRLRRISPDLTVTRAEADTADYSRAEILYAGALPHDPGRAPGLKWVQVHMAGVNGLYEHPIYANDGIALTTASGVHAATVAEYAITALLALAHRVPRMVEWHGRGTWPPDEQRWPLFVPTAVRGATLGVIGYGSIGRELARIAKTAFTMRGPGVQARSVAPGRSRLLPDGHRRSRGRAARRVVLARAAARSADEVGRRRDVRAAHAGDAADDRRPRAR